MSAGATSPGRARDAGIAVLCLALVVGALWWLGNGGERPLRRSAVGFDGLVAWLVETGERPARGVAGIAAIDPGTVGLRVLPLYDADPLRPRPSAETAEALVARQSEVDIDAAVLREKLRRLPSLLVLPKWRHGLRLGGAAHPSLLIEAAALDAALDAVAPGLGRVRRGDDPAGRIETSAGDVSLYLPQTVAGGACRPVLGDAGAMLLGECSFPEDGEGGRFWLLADPDLMNNHGLVRGDNAAVAADVVGDLADATADAADHADAGDPAGATVVVDYTTYVWAVREVPETGRSSPELLRFLDWPFTPFWAALLAFAGLGLWAGAVRARPAVDDADRAPGAAKTVAVAAEARLLRAAGHDRALLGAWLDARLAAALGAVGHRGAATRPEAALVARLSGRDAEAAADLDHEIATARAGLDAGTVEPAALVERARAIDALLRRTRP